MASIPYYRPGEAILRQSRQLFFDTIPNTQPSAWCIPLTFLLCYYEIAERSAKGGQDGEAPTAKAYRDLGLYDGADELAGRKLIPAA